MIEWLLWIVGIYGFCVAVVHAVYAYQRRRGVEPRTTYFVLLTQNNETTIEWYLRSLVFVSWLRARHIAIVVFDEGSTDETMAIIRHFADKCNSLCIAVAAESLEAFLERHAQDAVVIHRLPHLGKDEQLPLLMQW